MNGAVVSWRKAGLILLVLMTVSFAAGRFLAPERVEIKKEIVTVEVERKEKSTEKDRDTETIEITRPDGTKIKKKKTKTHTETQEKSEKDTTTKETETKVVENSRRLQVSVLAGPDFTNLSAPIVYGAHISRPFLGPITLGVWALSSGVGGVSIGLQF
jgi:hypothetical protein